MISISSWQGQLHRVSAAPSVALIALALSVPMACADDIEHGLWKISTRTKNGDAPFGPAAESFKCLTPEDTRDLAKTFSPVARTINSDCAPLESSYVDRTLSWKLVCKGQLNMELTGAFKFDSPRHYTATVTSRAEMGGMLMANVRNELGAERVSDCR